MLVQLGKRCRIGESSERRFIKSLMKHTADKQFVCQKINQLHNVFLAADGGALVASLDKLMFTLLLQLDQAILYIKQHF